MRKAEKCQSTDECRTHYGCKGGSIVVKRDVEAFTRPPALLFMEILATLYIVYYFVLSPVLHVLQ